MSGIHIPPKAIAAVANLIHERGELVSFGDQLGAAAPFIVAAYLRDTASAIAVGSAVIPDEDQAIDLLTDLADDLESP